MRLRHSLLVLIFSLLSACTSLQPKSASTPQDQSSSEPTPKQVPKQLEASEITSTAKKSQGFLKNYGQFELESGYVDSALIWQNPKEQRKRVARAKSLYVAPVTILSSESIVTSNALTPAQAAWIKRYIEESLTEHLELFYTIEHTPAEADLSLHLAFTEMSASTLKNTTIEQLRRGQIVQNLPQREDLNYESMLSQLISTHQVAVELEFVDHSNTRLFAMIAARTLQQEDPDASLDTLHEVGMLFDEWLDLMLVKLAASR